MCSIAIPSSELLLGHSPPVYGSLLYSSLMVTTPPLANRTIVKPQIIRPCLASASLHLDGLLKKSSGSSGNGNGALDDEVDGANAADATATINGCNGTAKRSKKRVVFADDRGRPLTQVRVMSEPSNMPPLWTSAYIANLARGELFRNLDGTYSIHQQAATSDDEKSNGGETVVKCADLAPWEASFTQPASDYLAFRNKLDKNLVSLENVIIKEAENCMIGTVKVKNVAYDKEVAIRFTSDNWQNHQDVGCAYVEQPGLVAQTAVRNLYDTFRFRVELPSKESGSRQVEFCVRYRTDGKESWDNNSGANYVVMKKRDVTLEEQVAELLSACCGPSANHNGFSQPSMRLYDKDLIHPGHDATRIHLRTWSEFASWQHLDNDAPYW